MMNQSSNKQVSSKSASTGQSPRNKKVMKKVGFGATCCGSSSLSLDGSNMNENGGDSMIVFLLSINWYNVTYFLNKMTGLNKTTEGINNQTKQQVNVLMMQFLDCQTHMEMAQNILEPKRDRLVAYKVWKILKIVSLNLLK